MRAARNRPVPILLALLLFVGCTRPDGDYRFVSALTARFSGGSYEFQFMPADSARCYATSLAARIVTSRIPGKTVSLDIRTTTPVGEILIERLVLPLEDPDAARIVLGNGSVADYQWPWRTLQAAGQTQAPWHISITPTDPAQAEAFYGIGLSCEPIPWEKAN